MDEWLASRTRYCTKQADMNFLILFNDQALVLNILERINLKSIISVGSSSSILNKCAKVFMQDLSCDAIESLCYSLFSNV